MPAYILYEKRDFNRRKIKKYIEKYNIYVVIIMMKRFLYTIYYLKLAKNKSTFDNENEHKME